MSPKDILDNLDNENIEDIELSKEDISELEKEKLKRRLKRKIKKNNHFKKRVAICGTSIILIGVIGTPAIASNIPILNNLYQQLGLFDGYEKYTNYIGETKESNGYKVTIENIIAVPDKLQAVIKVESEEPLRKNPKSDNFMVNVNIDRPESGTSNSFETDSYYIDDHTIILNYKESLSGGTYPKKGDLTLNIQKLSIDFKESNLDLTFDAKVDFSSAFKKKSTIKINKDINDNTKIEKLVSNAMGSEVVFSGDDIRYAYDSYAPLYYIEVDGKIYSRTYCSNMDFPELTYDVIKKSKSINIVVLDTNRLVKYEDILDANKIEVGTEDNIIYPKTIISQSGLKGEFYKIEHEEDKLKFYFKSEYEPLTIFDSLALSTYDNVNEKNFNRYRNEYTIQKSDEGYVAIFDNVDKKNNIELIYSNHGIPLDNYKEAEIIKIK